jgi:hypothetical protein
MFKNFLYVTSILGNGSSLLTGVVGGEVSLASGKGTEWKTKVRLSQDIYRFSLPAIIQQVTRARN